MANHHKKSGAEFSFCGIKLTLNHHVGSQSLSWDAQLVLYLSWPENRGKGRKYNDTAEFL
jgi:hypothetical protein